MNLRARLARAIRGRAEPTVYHVWQQSSDGADRFTSDHYPDVALTADELEVHPHPEDVARIIIVYRTATAAPRPGVGDW